MSTTDTEPNGCAICGKWGPRNHGYIAAAKGGHVYVEPTNAQRKERMLARRAARTPAPDTDIDTDERLREARGVATEVRRHERTIPDDLSRVERALLVIDAERRRLDAVVTAVRDLVSEDYQKTGREVSCGGYLVTDDGCFAGSLANRILRALDGVDKQS